MSSDNLNKILDYVYNGEVQIYQDQLDIFLDIAQRLKLDGLLAKDSNGCPDPIDDRQTKTMDKSKSTEYHLNNKARLEPEENQRNGIVAVPSKDIGGIDKKINELITRDDDAKDYKCNLCGKCATSRTMLKLTWMVLNIFVSSVIRHLDQQYH